MASISADINNQLLRCPRRRLYSFKMSEDGELIIDCLHVVANVSASVQIVRVLLSNLT